jgi:hypothetical protein
MGHGCAGRLFAVAQGGVKNHHAGLRGSGHLGNPWKVLLGVWALFPSERSRPKARSEARKKQQQPKRQRHENAKRQSGVRGSQADGFAVHGGDYKQDFCQGKGVL